MKLAAIIGKEIVSSPIILIGDPVETGIMTGGTDDTPEEPYFEVQLKSPVPVHCSVDPLVDSFETSSVYVRKSALESDEWEKEAEGDGYFIKGWVVDYVKSHEIPVYQATTVKKYFQQTREDKSNRKRAGMNERIQKRKEEAAAKKEAETK